MSTFRLTIEENNGKSSPFEIQIAAGATDGTLASLATAADALCLGAITDAKKSLDVAGVTLAAKGSAPVSAQRGQKLLITGIGADGELYQRSLPCADSSDLTAGTDTLDLAATDVAAFVTALEAVWKDDAGTAVTIDKIEYRNYNIQ